METSSSDIAASFDARAPSYNGNDWHRLSAVRLVELCSIRPGARVLDAGTGTGFAAIAAARVTGAQGQVVAVDLSPGMLQVAGTHRPGDRDAPIQWVHGDAVHLGTYPPASFDAVLCSAALLYMPVSEALTEWHRLLRPGGCVAFSSMRAGFPLAGRLFRECAAAQGIHLTDPSESLGSETACHAALQSAGFSATTVVADTLPFTAQDVGLAWESNLGSAAHTAVRTATPEQLTSMREVFESALAQAEQRQQGSASTTEVLFARGAR